MLDYDVVGAVAKHLDYDAFGNVVADSAPAVGALFRFTGRFVDPLTGKQWNLNRWYDPRTGGWLSQDPVGFAAGDANLNRYVDNGPTNDTDPSGLASWSLTPDRWPPPELSEWPWNWDWDEFGPGYGNSVLPWNPKAQPPVDMGDMCLRGGQYYYGGVGVGAAAAAGGLGAAPYVTAVATSPKVLVYGYGGAYATGTFVTRNPESVEIAGDFLTGAITSDSPSVLGKVGDGLGGAALSSMPAGSRALVNMPPRPQTGSIGAPFSQGPVGSQENPAQLLRGCAGLSYTDHTFTGHNDQRTAPRSSGPAGLEADRAIEAASSAHGRASRLTRVHCLWVHPGSSSLQTCLRPTEFRMELSSGRARFIKNGTKFPFSTKYHP